ncbi:MAG: hypothetical protein ABSD20_07830, partial [Terriglobales bacterium]
MRKKRTDGRYLVAVAVSFGLVLLAGPVESAAQSAPGGPPASSAEPSLSEVVRELQVQVRELRQSVDELREEAARYRTETRAMRETLLADKAPLPAQSMASLGSGPAGSNAVHSEVEPGQAATSGNQNGNPDLAKVKEDVQLLTDKVNQQEQTKVESGSKYHLRLYGIALVNLFENRGSVDSIDNPTMAAPAVPESSGSFGGTPRQSIIGLQAFGPQVAGARTTADVQFDFAAGFPPAENGDIYGIARLRTATLRMDWEQTSVVAGQDSLFFAPLSPMSFASVSSPALTYAGNLWAWTPQLRIEHRFDLPDRSNLMLQAGILDPLTGEYPEDPYLRLPTAGEAANQPAYAARVAYTHELFGRPLTVGAGGYYSRQDWEVPHRVNGWAGTSDLSVPP